MWHEIIKVIRQNHYFLLTTHVNPDGDGVGAATALTELLVLMGKEVRFVTDGKVPAKFSFLDYHQTFEVYHPQNDYKKAEVIIILDTNKKERVGHVANLFNQLDIIKICIDHHLAPELFTDYAMINPEACSAGAMVYELYKETGYPFNFQAASGVYTSVICDTGRFSYSSTNQKAHEIAEECIKVGVDPDLMYSKLFQHVSMSQIRMFINALQGMETYLNNKVIIETLSLKDCEKVGLHPMEVENIDLDYIHDFNKTIEDAECVFLLRELPGCQVRVSGRSTSNLDVCQILEVLGGGGHRNAAGVLIKGTIEEVKRKIIELIPNTTNKVCGQKDLMTTFL